MEHFYEIDSNVTSTVSDKQIVKAESLEVAKEIATARLQANLKQIDFASEAEIEVYLAHQIHKPYEEQIE